MPGKAGERMAINWAPILGECEQTDDKLVFKGNMIESPPGEGKMSPAIGNFLANQKFAGGTITAEIEFDDANVEEGTACSIIFYYNLATRDFATAGLGGAALYYITEFVGGRWTPSTAVAGDPKNLKSKRKYIVKISVIGSYVTLNVDGVDVLSYILPVTFPQTQVGIWCCSKSNITITNYKVRSEKPRAFVVMQFTPPYNELYTDVIKLICEDEVFGIETIRADEIFGSGLIVTDIERKIIESKLVIAEITTSNPNVYYEVGFARALHKPIILIAEKATQLPFDVSPFRVLFYENSIAGKKRIENGLRKHLEAIIGNLPH